MDHPVRKLASGTGENTTRFKIKGQLHGRWASGYLSKMGPGKDHQVPLPLGRAALDHAMVTFFQRKLLESYPGVELSV